MGQTIYWYKHRSKKKKVKNDFEKDFTKLMNNAFFGKTMKNVTKHTKLVTTERRRNYLVSELNYHTTKFFLEHLITVEMKKKWNAYD